MKFDENAYAPLLKQLGELQKLTMERGAPIITTRPTRYARSSSKGNPFDLPKQEHDSYMFEVVKSHVPCRNPKAVAYIKELSDTNINLQTKLTSLEKIITELTKKRQEIEANHKDELIEMQDRIDDLNTQLYLKDV